MNHRIFTDPPREQFSSFNKKYSKPHPGRMSHSYIKINISFFFLFLIGNKQWISLKKKLELIQILTFERSSILNYSIQNYKVKVTKMLPLASGSRIILISMVLYPNLCAFVINEIIFIQQRILFSLSLLLNLKRPASQRYSHKPTLCGYGSQNRYM